MRLEMERLFASLGIEYFSVLDYSDCTETAPHIMERESFTPRSVIMYLLPYYGGECVNISRYAASRDYHIAIREVNLAIDKLLHERYPDCALRGYGDHSPIDERHAALISGLGIAGRNGLLINEKYGSYVFIGDMVTDIPPQLLGAQPPSQIKTCEGCGACLRACPTGILRGEGESCLSEITQRKGDLSETERALMREHNTAWGCDLCQSSCPHNREPRLTPIPFFFESRIEELTRERLDAMSKGELKERAFGWRGRSVLERNLDILSNK